MFADDPSVGEYNMDQVIHAQEYLDMGIVAK